jgi:hypothetical protein
MVPSFMKFSEVQIPVVAVEQAQKERDAKE